jgi:hypothetical protein
VGEIMDVGELPMHKNGIGLGFGCSRGIFKVNPFCYYTYNCTIPINNTLTMASMKSKYMI